MKKKGTTKKKKKKDQMLNIEKYELEIIKKNKYVKN